jgi:hypothetical protein
MTRPDANVRRGPDHIGDWVPERTLLLEAGPSIDTGRDRGSITISLYRNGTLIQSATENGCPSIATVNGSYQ